MKSELFDLCGKTAIITGSTRGIGLGAARALAGAGANVAITSRTPEDCARVAADLCEQGLQAMGVATDVTDRHSVESMKEAVLSRWGSIDILVNNAGATMTKKAEEITDEEWNRILEVDLGGVFLASQVVGRQMIRQQSGVIINVASALGIVGSKQVLPYCVAKGGVLQMTRALALEWARHNIRVNALCPGYIETELNAASLGDERIFRNVMRSTPMRKLGLVEQMQGAFVYLAAEASSYMTGQALVVDGGLTAQ